MDDTGLQTQKSREEATEMTRFDRCCLRRGGLDFLEEQVRRRNVAKIIVDDCKGKDEVAHVLRRVRRAFESGRWQYLERG